MQKKNKLAIITGITGQDGSYLAKLLIGKEYKVLGLARSNNKQSLFRLNYLGIENKVITIECDLLDISSIIKVLLKYQPDEIYNLSAQSSVGLSFEQPIGTINYNISSFLNILESVRILNLNTRIYQASSSEMFGQVDSLPINIFTPMQPKSPYAISKATAYWIGVNYRESYGLYISNGILFNHESYLRGSNFFVKKVIRDSLLIVNGQKDKLRVGNIDIKRDFGYAPKYVDAMWLTLQQEEGEEYLICSGKSISLREIIEYVFFKLEIPITKIEIDKAFYRPSEIYDIYGDNSKAKEKLNWDYNLDFKKVLDILLAEEIAMLPKI
jgi:GDPmannose 4,6-dehydratase